ncbi:MAG: HAD-IIB family hydrolase [Bdellovibrionia bacterium]
MKSLHEFKSSIRFLLTDIDDTLTDDGQLGPEAYSALWDLHRHGIHVIPVTGRPAGWCEMIARQWPVAGVIGENGGFYFRYHEKQMKRYFVFDAITQKINREKLELIRNEVLSTIPGAGIASDQFCRLMDLAVDFCEDVPALPEKDIQQIVSVFKKYGAQAKVSSIHVNGWFGEYNKLSTALKFLQTEFGITADDAKNLCAFSGDSPNDEPMFEYFPHSFAVANINHFLAILKSRPTYIATERGGLGFVEIAKTLLRNEAP